MSFETYYQIRQPKWQTLVHDLEILIRIRGNTFTPNVFVGIYQLKLYILELGIYQLKYLTLITITNQVRHLKINSTLSMSGKDKHYSCFNKFKDSNLLPSFLLVQSTDIVTWKLTHNTCEKTKCTNAKCALEKTETKALSNHKMQICLGIR